MIKIIVDNKQFMKDMKGIIGYSSGYLEGINRGKLSFMQHLGKSTIEAMKNFVDSSARVNPAALQHMYEWQQTGSPQSRLFDIDYRATELGLSFNSEFRQSTSVKKGSNVPFYDKARIMELGIPVTITPTRSSVLAFTTSTGEEVFTKNPIHVKNPGGAAASGSFENALNNFITQYFSQSWLYKSGILEYIESSASYKRNLSAGKRLGKSKGISVGYQFIVGAGLIL